MNIREGTRRLAMLAGLVGAAAGGVASYATLSDLIEARARYRAFEYLATSKVVQEEQKYLVSLHLSADAVPDSTNIQCVTLDFSKAQPISGAQPLPPGTGVNLDMTTYQPLCNAPPSPPGTGIVPDPYAPYGGSVVAQPGGNGIDLSAGLMQLVPRTVTSMADKEGIKSIRWSKTLEVQSVEKEDGEVVLSAQRPSLWSYWLILIFPILGFAAPWGVIHALRWVGFGFIESPK